MSLKEARRIAKAARRHGYSSVTISDNKAACLLHNPKMHPMAGHYVVAVTTAIGSAHYLWDKADIGNPQPAI